MDLRKWREAMTGFWGIQLEAIRIGNPFLQWEYMKREREIFLSEREATGRVATKRRNLAYMGRIVA